MIKHNAYRLNLVNFSAVCV